MADIEFKTKGYFGGTYNAIGGVIRNEKTGESLYELSGMWSGEMVAKNLVVCIRSSRSVAVVDRSRLGQRRSCSTQQMRNTLHHPFDRWKSNMRGSHRSYGTKPL